GFLRNFRLTHQPSPWIGDWGHLDINLYAGGQITKEFSDWGDYAAVDVDGKDTKWTPYHWKAPVYSGGSRNGPPVLEMTPTDHAAVFRLALPKYEADDTDIIHPQVYIAAPDTIAAEEDCPFDENTACMVPIVDREKMTLIGGTRVGNGGKESNFMMYYYAEIDTDATITSVMGGSAKESYGGFEFAPGGTFVELRIATSLISQEQALLNFGEVRERTLEEVVEESKQVWNETLGAVNVEDVGGPTLEVDEERKTVFYTSLYRAALFPREISEIDKNGKRIHYSPFDKEGAVYGGPVSTDSGFWDAYHTVYALQSLLWPSRYEQTMQGYLNNYREGGGWIAQWSSPGFKNSMVGSMSDNIFSDAIMKGILTEASDVEEAWTSIRNDCYVTPDPATCEVPGHVAPEPLFKRPNPPRPAPQTSPSGTKPGYSASDPPKTADCHLMGRRCLQDYIRLGYVPIGCTDYAGDVHEVVSRTLNYANSDWAAARVAEKLGKPEAIELRQRGNNYQHIFHKSSKFFRPKDAAGDWVEPFDQWMWGGVYTEGGPWQYRFAAPHDVEGLAELYGGVGDMCATMNEVHTLPSVFHTGSYRAVIHEMGEMAQNCWGQFMHNNQPTHPNLYSQILAAASDGDAREVCADEARRYIKRAMNELYTMNGFAGDEDNGEHGAWMVLSSLGLYDVAPSSLNFVLGVPHFKKATVTLGSGKELVVSAPDNCSGANCFRVNSIKRNGRELVGGTSGEVLTYNELMEGGALFFGVKPEVDDNRSVVVAGGLLSLLGFLLF
ncbi:MAG: uncharacterized protein KVP18_004887, partial [Porospora cf. gigantea A]|uniref:uncharacterized protein n=2 Tax=Porospora cf. gigantea A TaxID=2853593 RepID=UPI00355A84AC